MAVAIGDIDDDDDDFDEAHDINVTPFIDVMLVLLIIFMVAAPLSTVDLPVDLPSSTAVPQKRPDKPTYVTIKADLAVAIGETPVKRVDLVRSLDAMSDEGKDRRIFLRADRGVPYGELMDVLERLRVGGYNKIALVALEGVPDDSTQPAPGRRSDHSRDRRQDVRSRTTSTPVAAALDCWPRSAPSRCMPAASRWRSRRCSRTTAPDLGAPAIEIGVELVAPRSIRPICRSDPTPKRRRLARRGRAKGGDRAEATCRRPRRPRPTIRTGSSRRTRPKKPKEDDPKITTVQTSGVELNRSADGNERPAPTVKSRCGSRRARSLPVAGMGAERAARDGSNVAKGAGRASQQIQALSGRIE